MIKDTRIRPIARRALAAQSDERLVRLFREGHEPAFEEIVGRYQRPLIAFAAAIVPYHRAEDVVQAALVRAHKALRADDREISLRAWLFTIVRNGALNVVRDDPDWQELDPSYDSVPQPAAVAEQNEELQALVAAICALPDDQREALVSRELRGDGHAQIASRLGTTTTAVRGLIFRARTALRNGLGAAIPLPVLRLMLIEGPAAGAAGAAGAVGLSGAAKLAATVSAAAIALGGGLVLEKDRGGDRSPAKAEAAESATGTGAGRSGSRSASSEGTTALASSSTNAGRSGSGGNHAASRGSKAGSDGGSRDGGGDGGGGHGGGDPGPGGGGPGPGAGGGDDDHGTGGPGPGGGDGGDDHSGPGGGGQPPDGDDHSGPGGGGEDGSGGGDGGDDHSGPGGGGELEDVDHSGSGHDGEPPEG